jgi:uncharacterized protein (DUF486 family)
VIGIGYTPPEAIIPFLVPLMLTASSALMAFAWLGHIRFRNRSYLAALLFSWILVLPEYILNVVAIRWGHGTFTGGAMAAFNLTAGVLCVALVAQMFLGEKISKRRWLGFAVLAFAAVLVIYD